MRIAFLAHRDVQFRFFVIENVIGLLKAYNDNTAAIEWILEELRASLGQEEPSHVPACVWHAALASLVQHCAHRFVVGAFFVGCGWVLSGVGWRSRPALHT
jgi:hypothetical protein